MISPFNGIVWYYHTALYEQILYHQGIALRLYHRVIKSQDTRAVLSETHSMSLHSDENVPKNVFNVHVNMPIDTKLSTCELCTYDI